MIQEFNGESRNREQLTGIPNCDMDSEFPCNHLKIERVPRTNRRGNFTTMQRLLRQKGGLQKLLVFILRIGSCQDVVKGSPNLFGDNPLPLLEGGFPQQVEASKTGCVLTIQSEESFILMALSRKMRIKFLLSENAMEPSEQAIQS